MHFTYIRWFTFEISNQQLLHRLQLTWLAWLLATAITKYILHYCNIWWPRSIATRTLLIIRPTCDCQGTYQFRGSPSFYHLLDKLIQTVHIPAAFVFPSCRMWRPEEKHAEITTTSHYSYHYNHRGGQTSIHSTQWYFKYADDTTLLVAQHSSVNISDEYENIRS